MINFDNAATTFPKPPTVTKAFCEAPLKYGGNASRGGHRLSMKTGEAVFAARERIAAFFGAKSENVVFTLNCTQALNYAIKGVVNRGDHIIISSLEHNSVSRPVHALFEDGIASYSIASVHGDDSATVSEFKRLIKPETAVIVCTLASNVTGRILPYRQIAALCREKGICFIADGAQLCGARHVELNDGINILCAPGHKGLYGPPGTGILVTDGKYPIHPLIEGGTGSGSLSLLHPHELPEGLEAGTLNSAGIIALAKGVAFVEQYGTGKIFAEENSLCDYFIGGLLKMKGFRVYREPFGEYAPIVSFNLEGFSADKLASLLDERGFALRAGFHCAALAHKQLGTVNGTIRFAPSVFNTRQQVAALLEALKNIAVNSAKRRK